MKIKVSEQNFVELIINLIKTFSLFGNFQSAEITYQILINSSLLENVNDLKNCLKLHYEGNYNHSYEILAYSSNIPCQLGDSLIYFLIQIEYLIFIKSFYNIYEARHDKIPCNDNPRRLFFNKRSKILKIFNVDFNYITNEIESKTENELKLHINKIYTDIINFLEDKKIIKISNYNIFDDFNNLFKFSFLNFLHASKSNSAVNNYFEKNDFEYPDQKFTNQLIVTSTSFKTDDNVYNENEKIKEKLQNIEESLNSINDLDSSSFRNDNYNNNKICNTSNDYNDFLLKLKIFNFLKKFVSKKKINKSTRLKRKDNEETALIFYKNLLKSRSFYGLLKWIKLIKYSEIIKSHYIEYKINYLSKYLLKNLIYVFNRKRLVTAYVHYKNTNKIKKSMEILMTNLRYKKNHRKLYLSQLMNNNYSVKFLIKICEVIYLCNLNVKQKYNFTINFQKLKIISNYNEKRKIFDIMMNFLILSRNYENQLTDISNKFSRAYFINKIKHFFNMEKRKNSCQKQVEKFLKKLFLLRFYYKKYKFQTIINKLHNSEQIIKLFFVKNYFFKLLRSKNKFRYINFYSKSYLRLNVLKKIFQLWKIHTNLQTKKYFLKNNNKINTKIEFFRKVKLISIEGLLIQGIIERYKVYSKKEFLYSLILFSINKQKLSKVLKHRKNLNKRKIFNSLVMLRTYNEKIFRCSVKYYFKIFKSKINYNKCYLDNSVRINDQKTNYFNRKVFFLKASKYLKKLNFCTRIQEHIKLNKIKSFYKIVKKLVKIKSNHSIQLKLNCNSQFRIFLFSVFIKKFYLINKYIKISKNKLSKIFLKHFIKNTNSKITISALKIFRRRMILTKNLKIFTNIAFSNSEKNFTKRKINKISKKFIFKIFIDKLKTDVNNKNINKQIKAFSNMKQIKRIMKVLKKNYLNNIKYLMLIDRYKEYLIINNLKILVNIILKK